jgi:hypothetical protein
MRAGSSHQLGPPPPPPPLLAGVIAAKVAEAKAKMTAVLKNCMAYRLKMRVFEVQVEVGGAEEKFSEVCMPFIPLGYTENGAVISGLEPRALKRTGRNRL